MRQLGAISPPSRQPQANAWGYVRFLHRERRYNSGLDAYRTNPS